MGAGIDGATLALILGVVVGAAAWLIKDKFAELARKDLALTEKVVEMAEGLAAQKAEIGALKERLSEIIRKD